MARKSLRPHLNQIRSWVRQGRTDAWIAHQLEVPVQDISEFKRQNDLDGGDEPAAVAGHYEEEIDMRAADDALIAQELEAAARQAEERRLEEEERAKEEAESKAKTAAEKKAKAAAKKDGDEGEDEEGEEAERGRRRGRRGGRGRKAGRKAGVALEGTFDHGEEGYGLWLDPAIQDDPVYAEHWAGHRPVEVTVEEEQIVIRRIREDG